MFSRNLVVDAQAELESTLRQLRISHEHELVQQRQLFDEERKQSLRAAEEHLRKEVAKQLSLEMRQNKEIELRDQRMV